MTTTPKQYPYYDDDEDLDIREPVDFESMLEALRQGDGDDGALSTTVYYGLSGLTAEQIRTLEPIWDSLDSSYRRHVIVELTETSETNYDLDYSMFGRLALRDSDGVNRAAAIELLWGDDSLEHMRELMQLAVEDDAAETRAAAASALGRFVLAGELGELPIEETNQAQDLAISIFHNPDEAVDVRRRALETLANSSNDNVAPAIHDAYHSDERSFQISAVFAMGRSCDEQWNETVIGLLNHRDAEMRYEAARAAGELEIEEAVPTLVELASGDDREIQDVAIWSLGEIGGNEALRALNRLTHEAEELKDEALLEAIEEAVANASLGSGALYMFNLDE